jgi:hypothetical protein
MPVILATEEAKMKRITVQGQSRQIVCKDPSPKLPKKSGLEAWLKQ